MEFVTFSLPRNTGVKKPVRSGENVEHRRAIRSDIIVEGIGFDFLLSATRLRYPLSSERGTFADVPGRVGNVTRKK